MHSSVSWYCNDPCAPSETRRRLRASSPCIRGRDDPVETVSAAGAAPPTECSQVGGDVAHTLYSLLLKPPSARSTGGLLRQQSTRPRPASSSLSTSWTRCSSGVSRSSSRRTSTTAPNHIEFEDLEDALTTGNRVGEVRTFARKREFNTSPSSYLDVHFDTRLWAGSKPGWVGANSE